MYAAVKLRNGDGGGDATWTAERGGDEDTEEEERDDDGVHGKKRRRVKKIEDCVRVRRRKNERGDVFAEAELRVVEGWKGVMSERSERATTQTTPTGSGRDASSSEQILVVRAKKAPQTDDERESGVQRWVGKIEGVVVEEHRFTRPMDIYWPEGGDAWMPSIQDELRVVNRNDLRKPTAMPAIMPRYEMKTHRERVCDTSWKKRVVGEKPGADGMGVLTHGMRLCVLRSLVYSRIFGHEPSVPSLDLRYSVTDAAGKADAQNQNAGGDGDDAVAQTPRTHDDDDDEGGGGGAK